MLFCVGWYNINLCVWGCFVWSDGVGGRSLAVLGLLLCVVDAGLLLCLGVAFLVCLFCAYGYVRMFGGFSCGFLVWVGAVVCFCVLRVGVFEVRFGCWNWCFGGLLRVLW